MMRERLRRWGLGRLWLKLYHRPVGRVAAVIRAGGPIAMRATERERQAMERAAATLPVLPEPPPHAPALHLLTGRAFWYQTAFCVHSFVRAAGEPVRIELYDDGTLDAEVLQRLAMLGPALRLHPQRETLERLDAHLPASRFPVLRERWLNYPHIRKLLDVHVGCGGYKLVIDSDLLFFRRPDVLLDWLRAPRALLHAVDCEESYGYSRSLMEEVAGRPIPRLVNVGLTGLDGGRVDWERLERWCGLLIERERTSYYLEQALVAMLCSHEPAPVVAPACDYITRPTRAQVAAASGVMHHYVAGSKRWYFRHGWRHVMQEG